MAGDIRHMGGWHRGVAASPVPTSTGDSLGLAGTSGLGGRVPAQAPSPGGSACPSVPPCHLLPCHCGATAGPPSVSLSGLFAVWACCPSRRQEALTPKSIRGGPSQRGPAGTTGKCGDIKPEGTHWGHCGSHQAGGLGTTGPQSSQFGSPPLPSDRGGPQWPRHPLVALGGGDRDGGVNDTGMGTGLGDTRGAVQEVTGTGDRSWGHKGCWQGDDRARDTRDASWEGTCRDVTQVTVLAAGNPACPQCPSGATWGPASGCRALVSPVSPPAFPAGPPQCLPSVTTVVTPAPASSAR